MAQAVTVLLLRWQEAREQGNLLSAEELCQDCPEHLEAVRHRIALLRQLNQALDAYATVFPDRTREGSPVPTRWPAVPGYQILGELGRGGMGVVYKAKQPGLKRLVALKMILAGRHANVEDLARFRSEAELIARLHHTHMVQIHEVGQQDSLPFFSLEFCPGGSLAAQLDGTPWPAKKAAALVEVLAQAIHAAHGRGVIHRDLKPANVLFAEDGTPKIADFGLAKQLDSDAIRTQSGAIIGTPSYMAPEQAGGKTRLIGPPTDVYALGAILYELLTGRPPFRAEAALDTVLQVISDEPVPPRSIQPKIDRDLETICLKCLRKEPHKRYASAAKLAADLRRFLAGEPITARSVGRTERLLKWARRNPVLAGMLASLALTLLVGTAVATFFAVRAERNADRADKKAQEADEQRRRAIVERDRAEALAYSARIGLAQNELQQGDAATALEYLDSCQWNQRGWEHDYLYTQFASKADKHQASRSFPGNKNSIWSVAYCPDGKHIISAGGGPLLNAPGELKVWDARTGTELRSLKIDKGVVNSVAYSPDGKHFASGSDDHRVKVWDAEAGTEVRTFTVADRVN
jgi:hypothetical protein